MIIRYLSYLFFITILTSCSYGRYQQKYDSTPSRLPTQAELKDAVPRAEAPSRGGNKHYQVRGKHYKVLPSAENFSQTGKASWYGEKFHGHLTSNGEIYNMYSMSAAHKNLPLPTYLKVTNLANNKSVIVRVNDRGPFHEERIIDLSYSAAYKLDMLKTGTADVSISVVSSSDHGSSLAKNINTSKSKTIKPPKIAVVAPQLPKKTPPLQPQTSAPQYIQAFATRNITLAESTANVLSVLYQQKSQYKKSDGIYRIHIGPIEEQEHLEGILENLKRNGYPHAFKHNRIM